MTKLRVILPLAALGAVLVAPAPLAAQSPAARLAVQAANPLAIRRDDETVALAWSTVRGALPAATAAQVRVTSADGAELPSQALDADGDGSPDSLLFKADFGPREQRRFTIEAAAPRTPAVKRVHVRHDDPRDDIAWENDRIAFRIYGEGLKKTSSAMSSSGIDVWVKSTRDLIVEKWYGKGHDSYHVDTGEGADFYDVGETLGNGGTALWRNDSLYRADNFKAWKIVANGPIRAIFELRYDPWSAGPLTVREVKRFIIDAGENVYRQESTFEAVGGGATEIPYAIGEVKRPGMVGIMSKAQPWAWLTGWGPVAPKNGGHGEMGTAVLVPAPRVTGWAETKDHYLAITHATSGVPVVHYIGAGWTGTRAGDFRTPQDWWAYLDRTAQRLAAPIKVSVVR
jgi:pectinesterase